MTTTTAPSRELLIRLVAIAIEPRHHIGMITYRKHAQRDHYVILDLPDYVARCFPGPPRSLGDAL